MKVSTKLSLTLVAFAATCWVSILSDRLVLSFSARMLVAIVQLILAFAAVHFGRQQRAEALQANGPLTPSPAIARKQIIILAIMPITALASFYFLPYLGPPIATWIRVYVGLGVGLLTGLFVVWKLKQQGIRFADHRLTLVVVGLIALVLAQCNVTALLRSNAMARVTNALSVANATRLAKGVSPESAREYIAEIRGIDLGYVPPEFKRALNDYTQSSDEMMLAFKANDNAHVVEAENRVKSAHAKLAEIVRKY